MVHWAGERLEKLGGTVEYCDIGTQVRIFITQKYRPKKGSKALILSAFQTLPDGTVLKLPPVLMGQLGKDPKKKTLLIYGHLDGK